MSHSSSRRTRALILVTALSALAASCSNESQPSARDCKPSTFTPLEFPALATSTVTEKEPVPPSSTPQRLRPLDVSSFSSDIEKLTDERVQELDTLLQRATIRDITKLFGDERLTSVELATYYLRRIATYDIDQLNSVLEIDPTVLKQAADADTAREAGETDKPLLGIPVLLKDNIAAGPNTHTTAGAVALSDWRPTRDATLVANLRNAGAIILGKTNMSEWANFMDDAMPSGFSAVGGQTNNPYGFPTPYGSSSGSAVAAAANFATITIGTETQGSIISPAGVNSAVGFKPSRGLVSRDLIVPLYEPQDTAGPMGRNVTDVALALTAMASDDPNDSRSDEACELFGTDFSTFLTVDADIRVGVTVLDDSAINAQLEEAKQSGLDADTLKMIRSNLIAERDRGESIAAALEKAGATVVRIPEALDPSFGDLMEVLPSGFRREIDNFLSQNADIGKTSLEDIVNFNKTDLGRRAPYGQGSLSSALTSSATPSELATAALKLETDARKNIDAMLAKHDIEVYVTTSNAYDQAGYPAVSVPFTYSAEDGPTGVIFSGSHLSDGALIATAFAFEQATRAWVPPVLQPRR